MSIKEFHVAARMRVNGISFEGHLVFECNPPQTDSYETLRAAAQLELRTLLVQTYEHQKLTMEMLNGSQATTNELAKSRDATNVKNGRSAPQHRRGTSRQKTPHVRVGQRPAKAGKGKSPATAGR